VSLVELFRRATEVLGRRGIRFAVAGGFAADIYRAEHRVTQDIDFSIVTDGPAERLAVATLEELGLHPAVARRADLAGGPLFAIRRGNTEPCMVVGRPAGKPGAAGVDLLLPALAWVPEAVRRAQDNLIDFGFGPLPTLTIEDVLLAKFSALRGAPSRFKDLDDLASIWETAPELDLEYLAGQMHGLHLVVPKPVADKAPEVLRRISRDVAKEIRRQRQG